MLPASATTAATSDLTTSGELEWAAQTSPCPWPGRPPWGPTQSQNVPPVIKNSSSSSSGTIIFLVMVSAVLLITTTLGLYSCAVDLASRTRNSAAGDRQDSSLYHHHQSYEHDPEYTCSDYDEQDMELRDVEAQGPTPEAEAVVGTARQARVYKPGAASMVDIRKKTGRGSHTRCGLVSSSSSLGPSARAEVGSQTDPRSVPRALCGGGGWAFSTERLSLREALCDEGMMGWTGGACLSRDRLSLGEQGGGGGGMASTDRLCVGEPSTTGEEVESPRPAPRGKKRQRNVLRKRVASGSR